MKEVYFSKFFKKKKKKKDFFSELTKEFLHVIRDVFLLYKNFLHWNISKLIMNIAALIVGLVLAFPFFLFAVFIGLIDPIPWMSLIYLQLQWVNPLIEALSYASVYTFSFVVMTLVMLITFVIFLIWNAYSNVLLARVYGWYIDDQKLAYKDNYYLSTAHIKKFVFLALWHGVILFIPLLILWSFVLVLAALNGGELITFELFSILLLFVVLIWIFVVSYTLFRIVFSVIFLSFDEPKVVSQHKAWRYIKKSFKLTSWIKKYLKFLFVFAFFFLITHPFRITADTIQNDIQWLRDTIEFRALSIANPEQALESPLADVALFYENLSDEKLFANYRWAITLSILLSVVWFLLLSGLYTMVFVSFYRRILCKS